MTPCRICGKPLLCGCERKQSTGVVQTCPKKEAAIWVLVMTPDGKGVEGVTVSNGEQNVARTNSSGVHQFENAVKPQYTISVTKLLDADNARYDLPEIPAVDVTTAPNTITQVLFVLRTKAKLRVQLIPGGNFTLPKADVVLHRITDRQYVNQRAQATLAEIEKKAHANGMADFGTKPADEYRVTVVFDKAEDKEYGAYDVDFKLLAGEDKLVQVEIQRYFKKVRFIGYCIASVPRQIWTGTEDRVLNFEREKAEKSVTVPKPDAIPEFPVYLADYWGSLEDKDLWSGRYNGPYTDKEDIDARIDLLREAIDTATKNVPADETELKVFLAPECFFLGRYGAYEHAQFGTMIQALQDLVGGAEWKTWLFAFGTANGVYDLDGRKEVFNVSPVVKGGWKSMAGDPSRYTRLMQKYLFSQEMLGQSDVDVYEPRKDLLTRTQISEDLVGKDFQATQNEELMGIKIQELLGDIDSNKIQVKTQINDWTDQRWETIRDEGRKEITARGLTALVRRIRDVKTDPNRRLAAASPDWSADLRYLLSLDVYFTPEFQQTIVKTKLDNFIFEDSCFSTMRMPGPLLDDVVRGEPTDRRFTKLTFGMETCADHNKLRLVKASANVAAHEKPDIHLVPSAGMILDAKSVVVVSKGLAFNCDGWNPLKMYGVDAAKRKAKIVVEENQLFPRRSGNNPLLPHTELWKENGGKFDFINADVEVKPINKDASNIFSYRTAQERKAYAEALSKIPRKLELLPYAGEIANTNMDIERITNSLRVKNNEVGKKEQDLALKKQEVQQIELQVQQKQSEVQQKESEVQQKESEVQQKELAVQQKELEVQQLTPPTQPTPQNVPQTSQPSSPQTPQVDDLKLKQAKSELEQLKIELEVAKNELPQLKSNVEAPKNELAQLNMKLKAPKNQAEVTMPKALSTAQSQKQKLEQDLLKTQQKVRDLEEQRRQIEQSPDNAQPVPEEPARGGELHIYPTQDLPVNY